MVLGIPHFKKLMFSNSLYIGVCVCVNIGYPYPLLNPFFIPVKIVPGHIRMIFQSCSFCPTFFFVKSLEIMAFLREIMVLSTVFFKFQSWFKHV